MAMKKKEQELPQPQLSRGCAGTAHGDTSVPHMGSASWEHPWEGWGEGHALPRSSPRKKQWHKSISRVINHPEGAMGDVTACGESKVPSSCVRSWPQPGHTGPAPGPEWDVHSQTGTFLGTDSFSPTLNRAMVTVLGRILVFS